MYRCVACDTPAQAKCECANDSYEQALNKKPDPWGFKEEEEKLDIQSGVRVKPEQMKEYA